MNTSPTKACLVLLLSLALPACHRAEEHHVHAHRKIVATSPVAKDVVTTQEYVCQIHSRRHIELRALERGYLERITVTEGQSVKAGDVMFKILPTLYQAKLDADQAEAELAEIEYVNTKNLNNKQIGGRSVVAQPAVAMAQAKLAKAQAKVKLAQAELNFTDVKAPFDGIIDRLMEQQGSLVKKGTSSRPCRTTA